MIAKILSIAQYAIGGVGLYIALTHASSDITQAIALASLFAVGFVGVVSFISHVLFHKQDAKRIGFGQKETSFQYEVGFANLAMGIAAIVSYVAGWGIRVNAALLLVYALYMLQAAILHIVTGLRNKKTRTANLRRGILALAFSAVMYYVFYLALTSVQF